MVLCENALRVLFLSHSHLLFHGCEGSSVLSWPHLKAHPQGCHHLTWFMLMSRHHTLRLAHSLLLTMPWCLIMQKLQGFSARTVCSDHLASEQHVAFGYGDSVSPGEVFLNLWRDFTGQPWLITDLSICNSGSCSWICSDFSPEQGNAECLESSHACTFLTSSDDLRSLTGKESLDSNNPPLQLHN